MRYDYIVVGCGLFGVVFAREMTNVGKRCLIIDKRKHIGGNVYTENIEGINVHVYGPHIFHTSDESIWNYVNKYAKFNNFRYEPLANFNGNIYNLPFNMNTFSKMWGVVTPQEAMTKINSQIVNVDNPKNLEEFALSKVGLDIYNKLIKGYTKKQWGTDPVNLPISIIKRIPLRFNYDNNYYNDIYQGIPIGGYTKMIQNIIGDIEVKLDRDFLENKQYYESLSDNIVYTGKIDEFFEYKFGELEYRSLKFETEILNIENYQGVAGVNYTDLNVPWTRIIEHKHFEMSNTKNTIITREYPQNFDKNNIPYYPINDDKNNKIYQKYKELSKEYPNIIFGGRLAEYKYYDMHQIIGSALSKVKKINDLKNIK
jgi:UDP-galactopyranose mutase